ncbi:MAG: hypothetical protein JJ975_08045 [Bacteroidia bacterium]|nr:hypothetical protein [Bacteroidia bacterium]
MEQSRRSIIKSSLAILVFSIFSGITVQAQNHVSTDSLTRLFYVFNDTSDGCRKLKNNVPCKWFKLRNTELGLVVYERNNKPFNIQFLGDDTLFYDDWFEFYHYVIDSMTSLKNQYDIYCHDTVAWGDIDVHFKFSLLDKKNQIYKLTSSLSRVEEGTAKMLSEESFIGLFTPYLRRKYLVLAEPNPRSFDSEIKFLDADLDKLEVYRP